MKLSAIGPNTIVEAMDPERTEATVRKEVVIQSQESHLDTELQNAPKTSSGNLSYLIEEAKKRALIRKNKGAKAKRRKVILTYENVEGFEEILDMKGLNLDQKS